MIPGKGQLRLLWGRRSKAKRYYFLTAITHAKRPLFRHAECAESVISCLRRLERYKRIELFAAVVMPDHVHFIVRLRSDSLDALMRSFKACTERAINRVLIESGPVWQPQYYDYAFGNKEELTALSQYCVENPVRSGLVGDVREYPYWYCRYGVRTSTFI